ncbi:MAG: hypothetical protein KG003_05565 [Bacteroidetes bacterium]|nr:hypothetical protein [Bacteroidota bacterium]
MKNIEYFDYKKTARENHLSDSLLQKIEKEVQLEFPNDKMMFELHVLRAINSRYWEKETDKEIIVKPLTTYDSQSKLGSLVKEKTTLYKAKKK